MSKRAFIPAVLLPWLLLTGGDGVRTVAASTATVTLAPGTSAVSLGDATFMVSTDRTISLTLNVEGEAIDGLVAVRETSPALVKILWRNNGLTIFAGPVIQCQPIRYRLPMEYPAIEDSGHTEK